MQPIAIVGLDLAKNLFHGIDAEGKAMIRPQLRRSELLKFFKGIPSRLIGMEACASALHWARHLIALGA
jgi:transposase